MLDFVTDTAVRRGSPTRARSRPDTLFAIEHDMLRYEREATEVRKWLSDLRTRILADSKFDWQAEMRQFDLRDDWDKLNNRATEIEERACAVVAKTASELKIKQRVAAWLRIRAPGLDYPHFAQTVLDSMQMMRWRSRSKRRTDSADNGGQPNEAGHHQSEITARFPSGE